MRALAREKVRTVLTTATSPLEVLTQIAADVTVDAQLRVQAAAAAVPFLHPRLSAAIVAHTDAAPQHEAGQVVERILHKLARLVPAIEHAPAVELVHEAEAA